MLDDGKELTARRAFRAPEFWLMLVTAVAATFGVAWWVAVPLATAGLSISSLPKYVVLWARARALGVGWEWWKTVALSMFNNMGAACAAFAMGIFSRWLWW